MSNYLARLGLFRPCTQRKVLCSGELTLYWLLRLGLWSLGTSCPTYCFHMPEASGRVHLFGEIFNVKMWLLVTVIFCVWSVWPQADRGQIIGVIPPGIASLCLCGWANATVPTLASVSFCGWPGSPCGATVAAPCVTLVGRRGDGTLRNLCLLSPRQSVPFGDLCISAFSVIAMLE